MPNTETQASELDHEVEQPTIDLTDGVKQTAPIGEKTPLTEIIKPGNFLDFWMRLRDAAEIKYHDKPKLQATFIRFCESNHAKLQNLQKAVEGKHPKYPPSAGVAIEWYQQLGSLNELVGAAPSLLKAAKMIEDDKGATLNQKLTACQIYLEAAEKIDETADKSGLPDPTDLRNATLQKLAQIELETIENNPKEARLKVDCRAIALDIAFQNFFKTCRERHVPDNFIATETQKLLNEIKNILESVEQIFESTTEKTKLLGWRSEIALACLGKKVFLAKQNWDEIYSARLSTLREDVPHDGISKNAEVAGQNTERMSFDLIVGMVEHVGGKVGIKKFPMQVKTKIRAPYESSVAKIATADVLGNEGIDTIIFALTNGGPAMLSKVNSNLVSYLEKLGGRYYKIADALYLK